MSHFRTRAHASIYAKFRPVPPPSLEEKIIEFLKEKVDELQLAVDVGCGSGQSASVLTKHFGQIHAYDISEAQIQEAKISNRIANLSFGVSAAEKLPEASESAQLITAGQSVHWFDVPKFYDEVKRILVPGGVLALYGYLLPRPKCEDQIKMDSIVYNDIYMGSLAKYWTSEGQSLDNSYRDIRPIFEDYVRVDGIEDVKTWSVADYVNYIRTWSAYQAYLKESPAEAANFAEKVNSVLMDEFGKGGMPETTNIEVKMKFFLVMARKPSI